MLYHTQKVILKQLEKQRYTELQTPEEIKIFNFANIELEHFRRRTLKAHITKRKIALSDYIKTKTFGASKDTINRVKQSLE